VNGRLEGKSVLITGGSTGIGLSAAARMIAKGALAFIKADARRHSIRQ